MEMFYTASTVSLSVLGTLEAGADEPGAGEDEPGAGEDEPGAGEDEPGAGAASCTTISMSISSEFSLVGLSKTDHDSESDSASK